MDNKNFTPKDSGKAFLWAMFLPQGLSLIFLLIMSMFYKTPQEMQSSYFYAISMMLVAQVAFSLIYFTFLKKKKINFINVVKEQKPKMNARNILLCVLISIIAIAGFINLVGVFNILFEKIGYVSSAGLIQNTNFGYLCLNIVLSVIIPAIVEELMFRGLIFRDLRKRGFWLASLVSSAMFMLVHLNLGSLIYPLIMGFVFALVLEKTGSVVYTIIVHACNNLIVNLIEYFNLTTGKNFGMMALNSWWQILLSVVIAILAFVAIWLIVKFLLKKKEEEHKEAVIDVLSDEELQRQKITIQIQKRTENIYVFGSLLLGIIFWLVVVISGL